MHTYSLLLSLDGPHVGSPTCRAWIDASADVLDGEFEVPLKCDGNGWRGSFQLRNPNQLAYYRVGLVAPVRTTWSFTLCREITSSECVILLSDKDRVTQPKTWLLGSWEPAYSARPFVQALSPCARAARSCFRVTTLFAERAAGVRCLRLTSSLPRAGR
jgi:hypothetical protein